MRRVVAVLLFLAGISVAAAQDPDPPASHVKFGCDTHPTLPDSGSITIGLIDTPLPDSVLYLKGGQMQTLSGLRQYSARVLMHTPEDNFGECSVRQYRLILPRLQTKAPGARIQVTIQSPDSVGAGSAMILFGIERFDTDKFTEYVINAQTPAGYQSPYTYYANITVIGKP